MKSTKWRKWKLSKFRFPTFIIHGMNGPGTGSLSIGRVRAKAALAAILGQSRVDRMRVSDTKAEWVFMEPIKP